jgi:peptidoglycan/xylan/chitin deacetylase (PgdA/CDA1 family)
VPPETIPPLRAPALLALSLTFLALVGWGPALRAPSGGSHLHAASGGGGRGSARAAATRGRRTLVGCRAGGASYRRFGSRRRHVVALGFDDGPSSYTERVLGILRANHAHATFFEIGRLVPRHRAVMRRILRAGDTIGNHSLTHANLAGGGAFARFQLRKTNFLIHHETGFRPCLFRPPYGAVSAPLVREAHAAGMVTVDWDVDPRDYAARENPRYIAGAVSKNVRNGSIVVLHDGGGDRTPTVHALGLLLRRLHRHGYRVVSVDQVLGLQRHYA